MRDPTIERIQVMPLDMEVTVVIAASAQGIELLRPRLLNLQMKNIHWKTVTPPKHNIILKL